MKSERSLEGLRGWAFLACRVLSLYVLYYAFKFFSASSVLMLVGSMKDSTSVGDFYFVFNFLLDLSAFAFLWFGAPWLSSKVAPPTREMELSGDQNIRQLMSLVISVFGLILLVNAIPNAASVITAFTFETGNWDIDRLAEVIVQAGVGLFLIFGRKGIADLVHRARAW